MVLYRKWWAAILLACLMLPVLAIAPPVTAADIKDLDQCSDYARPAVERLISQEVIKGDKQGNFLPKSTVTRGEMITIIVRALKIEASAAPAQSTFSDVPLGHWANPYVETAFARGIVNGISNGRFGVDQRCTREEMAAMFVRSFKVLDDSGSVLALPMADLRSFQDNSRISSWAREAMGFAYYSGILFGTSESTIAPNALAIREQAAVLVDRFLSRYQSIKADRQAAMLLNNAENNLNNTHMLANNSFSKTEFALWKAYEDLPAAFSVATSTANRAVWPGLLYALTELNMPGLPANEYPPYTFEQYLADGIVYEKVTDGLASKGWERYPAMTSDEVAQVMAATRESLTAMLEPGLAAHQTGTCSIEATTLNGTPVKKITYSGKISDLESYLLEVLPALMPQDTSSPQSWAQDLLVTYTDASFTQVYFIGTSNDKLMGTELTMQVSCRSTNDANITPIKTMTVNAGTTSYRYDNVTVELPAAAKTAPEKQVN